MKLQKSLSASEIGTLWLTYQEKTLIVCVLEHFISKAEDQEAVKLMEDLLQELNQFLIQISSIFGKEGIERPLGFRKEDVNLSAPKLYDNGFDILFVRTLKEVSMGMYTINMGMAYREDVISLYKDLTAMTQRVFQSTTAYLLNNGIIVPPPKVTYPEKTEFIQNKTYLNGFNPFKHPRALSDIELGILHQGLESNSIGLQLITGFAQCSSNKQVRKYFLRGLELAKKQIEVYLEILMKNGIQPTVALGSNVTTSTVAPFSQKLMMYCIYLLNGFGLVGNSFGTIFTLRNDITVKAAWNAKNIFLYANDGLDIMIKNGWMEEPPQTEDRSSLFKL